MENGKVLKCKIKGEVEKKQGTALVLTSMKSIKLRKPLIFPGSSS